VHYPIGGRHPDVLMQVLYQAIRCCRSGPRLHYRTHTVHIVVHGQLWFKRLQAETSFRAVVHGQLWCKRLQAGTSFRLDGLNDTHSTVPGAKPSPLQRLPSPISDLLDKFLKLTSLRNGQNLRSVIRDILDSLSSTSDSNGKLRRQLFIPAKLCKREFCGRAKDTLNSQLLYRPPGQT
jgi:hypothetical protein